MNEPVVVLDRVSERLAVALATVKVDHANSVAMRGVDLRVPAVRPVVAPRALRATVDQVRERHLGSVRHRAGHWLQVPAMNRIAIGALEPELLRRRHPALLEQLSCTMRETE